MLHRFHQPSDTTRLCQRGLHHPPLPKVGVPSLATFRILRVGACFYFCFERVAVIPCDVFAGEPRLIAGPPGII